MTFTFDCEGPSSLLVEVVEEPSLVTSEEACFIHKVIFVDIYIYGYRLPQEAVRSVLERHYGNGIVVPLLIQHMHPLDSRDSSLECIMWP